MPTLVLFLAPLLAITSRATATPEASGLQRAASGPPPSLCLPPNDSATTPRRELGRVSFQVPPGYDATGASTAAAWFESAGRYIIVTTEGDRQYLGQSDFLGRTSCHTRVDGRAVTITQGTMELEASRPMEGPGLIGAHHIAIAEWDQPVSGRALLVIAVARDADGLQALRTTMYSLRIAGDSVAPTMTLAQLLPHWTAVRVDTVAGLELETQTMAGSARFVARSVGSDAAVTTPELEPDSVRAWANALDVLGRTPDTKIRALGSSVAATATQVDGKPAVAVSFAEETSDAQVALAMTPSDAARLAGALRAAMDAVKPPAH